MSTAITLKQRPAAPGGGGLTPNRFKKLEFDSAPAAMEFGLSIGEGTDPVMLTGHMEADAVKAALEASLDLESYAVDVYGNTQVTGNGPDGVALHSGSLLVVLHGAAPFPAWGAVQNAEVQNFVVIDGEAPSEPTASHYLVSGSGSPEFDGEYFPDGSLNGKDAFKKDDTHYLYFDGYWEGDCWVLHVFKSSLPGQINQPGQEPFYLVYSSADSPPAGGWQSENGSSPAPTVTFIEGSGGGSTGYTLNAGAHFQMGISETDLQANQRTLGGGYTNVVLKGVSIVPIPGDLTDEIGGTAFAAQVHDGYSPDVFFNNAPGGYAIDGPNGYCGWDFGAATSFNKVRLYWTGAYQASQFVIQTSNTGAWSGEEQTAYTYDSTPVVAGWFDYDFAMHTARYMRVLFPVSGIFQLHQVEVINTQITATAEFNSYFPFSAGDVGNPSATGTNATVSTLHQGGSESQLVVASQADAGALLLLGLQSPLAAPAAGEFTPNPSHWVAPLPATQEEALNRIAAMIYNWWLYSIPTLP